MIGALAFWAHLLLALAVMPIQQSHFFTMDNWAAGLTTMTLYTAVRAANIGDESKEWRALWYVLFGIGLGLATASRINIAPLAAMIVVGAFLWLSDDTTTSRCQPWHPCAPCQVPTSTAPSSASRWQPSFQSSSSAWRSPTLSATRLWPENRCWPTPAKNQGLLGRPYAPLWASTTCGSPTWRRSNACRHRKPPSPQPCNGLIARRCSFP